VLDLWRNKSAPDAWIETFRDLALKRKPVGWAGESGQIAPGIGPFLEKRMRERQYENTKLPDLPEFLEYGPSTSRFLSRPSCTGSTKPIASSIRFAVMANSKLTMGWLPCAASDELEAE
jgi:hypothetical protein